MKLWRSFDDAEAAEKGGGPGPAAQIFLRPRSLNVLAGDVYSRLLHSIDATRYTRCHNPPWASPIVFC
jgi:hypothetical protein